MDFAEQVMDLQLDPTDKNFAKVLAAKQAIASSMLTATARMRGGLLQPGAEDAVEKVLRLIREAEEEG